MLRCEECERSEEEARRWRAYLTSSKRMSPKRWLFYCPDCAKREFEVDNG
jgi:Zn finger protein HypA/HybF involved in hydrogenase expression